MTHGSTDDFGYEVESDPVHVRDLHATMMHLLGIDHETFSYRFQGLHVRLTGVEQANVLNSVLV